MVKMKVEGEGGKVNEFLNNLKEYNFIFSTISQEDEEQISASIVISETPGTIPDELEFSYRGFLSQWIREGLHSCLKDFCFLSDKGKMVSFDNMIEFVKVYEFLIANFGPDDEIYQMIEKINRNNKDNFEHSGMLVYGCDSEFDDDND